MGVSPDTYMYIVYTCIISMITCMYTPRSHLYTYEGRQGTLTLRRLLETDLSGMMFCLPRLLQTVVSRSSAITQGNSCNVESLPHRDGSMDI